MTPDIAAMVAELREGHAVPGCDCWLCQLLNGAADTIERLASELDTARNAARILLSAPPEKGDAS